MVAVWPVSPQWSHLGGGTGGGCVAGITTVFTLWRRDRWRVIALASIESTVRRAFNSELPQLDGQSIFLNDFCSFVICFMLIMRGINHALSIAKY